jgi:hypothetical protein
MPTKTISLKRRDWVMMSAVVVMVVVAISWQSAWLRWRIKRPSRRGWGWRGGLSKSRGLGGARCAMLWASCQEIHIPWSLRRLKQRRSSQRSPKGSLGWARKMTSWCLMMVNQQMTNIKKNLWISWSRELPRKRSICFFRHLSFSICSTLAPNVVLWFTLDAVVAVSPISRHLRTHFSCPRTSTKRWQKTCWLRLMSLLHTQPPQVKPPAIPTIPTRKQLAKRRTSGMSGMWPWCAVSSGCATTAVKRKWYQHTNRRVNFVK